MDMYNLLIRILKQSKAIIDGQEVITLLSFPPYYPKTVPASVGIFASIDEIFTLSFGYKPNLYC